MPRSIGIDGEGFHLLGDGEPGPPPSRGQRVVAILFLQNREAILMTPTQWWVALSLAGMMVLMQLYDRLRPIYDTSKSAPAQSQVKRK
jgi:hypothetical protein